MELSFNLLLSWFGLFYIVGTRSSSSHSPRALLSKFAQPKACSRLSVQISQARGCLVLLHPTTRLLPAGKNARRDWPL